MLLKPVSHYNTYYQPSSRKENTWVMFSVQSAVHRAPTQPFNALAAVSPFNTSKIGILAHNVECCTARQFPNAPIVAAPLYIIQITL